MKPKIENYLNFYQRDLVIRGLLFVALLIYLPFSFFSTYFEIERNLNSFEQNGVETVGRVAEKFKKMTASGNEYYIIYSFKVDEAIWKGKKKIDGEKVWNRIPINEELVISYANTDPTINEASSLKAVIEEYKQSKLLLIIYHVGILIGAIFLVYLTLFLKGSGADR